jgi:hypothetical protein
MGVSKMLFEGSCVQEVGLGIEITIPTPWEGKKTAIKHAGETDWVVQEWIGKYHKPGPKDVIH